MSPDGQNDVNVVEEEEKLKVVGDDDANDANGKDLSEGKVADAIIKVNKNAEDEDENTDKSATNSEYILSKACYEKM